MHTRHVQESLANAKVHARQQHVYEGRPLAKKSKAFRQINVRNKVEKCIQWVSTLSLTIWVYLYSFSSCCLQKLRNLAKFSKNSDKRTNAIAA